MMRLLIYLGLTLLALMSPPVEKESGGQSSFTSQPIPDAIFLRMQGKSYPEGCTVARSDLRYLRVLHYDAEGHVCQGEMVCNKAIAADLLDIFRQLYRAKYPIQQMRLIDDYDADDERSMTANNSSCFCYRPIAGSRRLSRHAVGMAVDLNPLYNPQVRRRAEGSLCVQPTAARQYADRSRAYIYKIDAHDLACRLFLAHGFRWGGNWRSSKDYQHFEK